MRAPVYLYGLNEETDVDIGSVALLAGRAEMVL